MRALNSCAKQQRHRFVEDKQVREVYIFGAGPKSMPRLSGAVQASP